MVVGAFAGRGRRTGVYGAVLLAAYDADADMFRAVTKCGAGFTDADLAGLVDKLKPFESRRRAGPGRRAAGRPTCGSSRAWCSRSCRPS